jgi:DNA-binding beta-propeller fold protein YncE
VTVPASDGIASHDIPSPARRKWLIIALILMIAVCGSAAALIYSRQQNAPTLELPLRTVATVALPAPSSRFDYADVDPDAHRLFLAQLGASRLLTIDTAKRQVIRVTGGLSDIHGVIVVPALHRVFVTATGSDQLVALDENTGKEVFRTPTGTYPDGLVYIPSTGQVWVSNETGGSETVVDAVTGGLVGTVPLGGEAGNVGYDSQGDRVLVDVQTANEVAVIDPHSLRLVARASVPGCDNDHGLLLDSASSRAFVACDGNAVLVVLSLPSLCPIGTFSVGDGPDVLALDQGRHLLYVTAESGVVTTFDTHTAPGHVTGRAYLGNNAHVVALDPSTGEAYFPLLNDHGPPTLLITKPR